MERRPTGLWWAGFALSSRRCSRSASSRSRYQIATGIGTWGLNRTVGWAFDITNFVFWIGIGHAGTLISAILFLFRQRWRTVGQPLGRGDDDLRRDVRRASSR